MTYEEAKKRRTTAVFRDDGFGGVIRYVLDWDTGEAVGRGEPCMIAEVFADGAACGTLARAVEVMGGE